MENKKYKYYYTIGQFIEVYTQPKGGIYMSHSDISKLFGITVEQFQQEYIYFMDLNELCPTNITMDNYQYTFNNIENSKSTLEIENATSEFYELLEEKYKPDALKSFNSWLNMIMMEQVLERDALNGEDKNAYLTMKYMNRQNEIKSANEGICLSAKAYIDYMQKINDSFSEVLNRLVEITKSNQITPNDVNLFKSIDLMYNNYELTPDTCLQAGKDIKKHLFLAAIEPFIIQLKMFYGVDEISLIGNKKLNEMIVLFFKINLDAEFLVDFTTEFTFISGVILKDYNQWFRKQPNSFDDKFWFEDLYFKSEDLNTTSEKLQHFKNEIIAAQEWLLIDSENDSDKQQADIFIDKCNRAIEFIQIKNQLSPKVIESTVDELLLPLPDTDITLNRQFLALYYLLNEVDKEAFARNKSEIARFIQLLTGKSYENIYKLTKNPVKDPVERTSKKYQSDIKFVKESFLKLGLNKIAQQIENDNLVG